MKFKFGLAALAAAALIGLSIAHAQGPGAGTIVLKVPADATVTVGDVKTTQKGAVRTFYTPELPAGYKYQYEVTITWTEGGAQKKKSAWVDVTPGKTTSLDWTTAAAGKTGPDTKKDVTKKVDPKDTKKEEVKKVDTKKEDIKKEDVKKVDTKEDVKKEDVKKVDTKKEDAKKADPTDTKKEEVKKVDTKKEDTKKVDPPDTKKEDVKKVDTKKEDTKKVDPPDTKKEDVKKVDTKKEDTKKVDPPDTKKEDVKKVDAKKEDTKKEDVPADEKGFVQLFEGKDLFGFKENVFGKKDAKSPFTVKDGVIEVAGSPNGYFYTEKSYKNYVLRFDWKFLKDGNSGLLVHIQNHGGSWPKCIEVQGMQKDHGNIFALGAKGSFKKDAAAQKEAIKIGEWNTTEVVSQDGKLIAKINGIEVSSGQSELTEGTIGWQSEGVPLQFKNIRIKAEK